MEHFFLEIGLSWTLSKIIPYTLALILGLVIFYIVRKKSRKKVIRNLSFAIIPIPIVIYFLVNPIYEGDFANSFKAVQKTEKYKELEVGHLTIITIPGCPYCEESLDNLIIMSERIESNVKLDFIVCSDDSSTMNYYKEKSGEKINISLAQDPNALSVLAEGSFPCFAFLMKSGEIRLWSNDGFGVRAKDWIESRLL